MTVHNGWAIALPKKLSFFVILLTITVFLTLVLYTVPSQTLKAQTHKIIQNTPFSTPYTFRGQAIQDDVHLIKDADEYLSHFTEVVRYPSMPISDAKAGCGWPDESYVSFAGKDTVDEWHPDESKWLIEDESDFKIELHRRQWQYFVEKEMRPWQPHRKRFSGKGIVIPGGHKKSVYRMEVLLKMLNKLGSTIPVEIAFWGKTEMMQEDRQRLSAIREVYFNDLSEEQPMPIFYSDFLNFQLKIAAVLNSRFAEVVLMDSDNIPVVDPITLFDSAVYKEFGTVFWPDVVRTRRQNPVWAVTNTQCKMDEWEQESGQVLVDKRRYWYHLQLASWMETGSYYRHLILGDKDAFRFAWHALRTKFGVPNRWLTSVGTLSPGNNGSVYCGHSFAQHHPDTDAVAFLHGGLLKTLSKNVLEWQVKEKGGIFQVYKQDPNALNKMSTPRVHMDWDPAWYLPEDKGDDYRVGFCTDFPDSPAKDFNELVPDFQKTYAELGGYWLLGT